MPSKKRRNKKKTIKSQVASNDSKSSTEPRLNYKTDALSHNFSTTNIKKSRSGDYNYSVSVKNPHPKPYMPEGVAMDSAMDSCHAGLNGRFAFAGTPIPEALTSWYASQGWIGYQMCAIIAQHWLVNKACTIPARDAVRKGYDITVNNGDDIEPEVIDKIKEVGEKKYKLTKNMIEYVRNAKIFGIRHCLFLVDGIDYEKPFNIDGVQPGSYKGMSQIDPIWLTPLLDQNASANPSDPDYYEPTWWQIGGISSMRVHKSHFVIMRHAEVSDLLKPSYQYGGISLCQQIYERAYASDRTANEAPMLAMTKRMITYKSNLEKFLANEGSATEVLEMNNSNMTNYSTRVIGMDEDVIAHDTSLADLDSAIMTQYQLDASIAEMPATKLMGTQPKGFNSAGEYEESVYRETLESIQECDLTPLADRNYELVMKSDIAPMFNVVPFPVSVQFTPLDALTEKEQAEINLLNAQGAATLMQQGALSQEDERQRLINDEDSGYSGMSMEDLENDEDEDELQVRADEIEISQQREDDGNI